MERNTTRNLLFTAAILLAVPAAAYAHIGMGHTAGFADGAWHPASGLDHILAMVAVGIWAAQAGGRAVWAVPSAFVGMMLAGGALGMAGAPLLFVEQGIAMSVLIMGVLIAAAVRMPVAAGMSVVGLFALFHGHAHGTEIIPAASGLAYSAGFAIVTAVLHAAGIGFGVALQQRGKAFAVRFAGAGIAACGMFLAFIK